jgi:hypothetical protein
MYRGRIFELVLILVLVVIGSFSGRAVRAQDGEEEEKDPYATIPEQLTTELTVQAATNGTDIFWRLSWPSENAGIFHDFLVYTDGEWKRRGDSGDGSDPDGLREDRVLIMLDTGAVGGFANQGCYVGCHDGMVSLDNAVGEEEIAGSGYWPNEEEVSKYILESRIGSAWWDAEWDAIKSEEEIAALQEAGVFLDLWHWRAHRGNPIGYSDNQYVQGTRSSDGSTAAFKTNVVSDTGLPEMMFDPSQVGFRALKIDEILNGNVTQEDYYYLSTDIATEFDPNYAWENGDAIPRRLLRTPEGAQAAITADGRWENGRWTVVLQRSLAEEFANVSHPLVEGRVYNAAFAVHDNATGARWHYISQAYRVGIDTPADITALRFDGSTPDWDAVPAVTLPLYYPGQTTWNWLTSDAHPGAAEIRDNSRSCRSCHGDTPSDVLKLAQASVYHEVTPTGRSTNWYLTLAAVVSLFVGGTVAALSLFNKRS